ncbi:MAG: polysaccharide deacetylase family protein, partial [Bacteroidota bacterium]
THPDLTKISLEDAEKELVDSKNVLEKKLGIEIKTLAYPYGNCNEEIKEITLKAGYKFAFATDKAPLGLHEDIYQIRRIGIFPNTTVQGLARKVKGNYIFKREKKDSPFLQIPRLYN